MGLVSGSLAGRISLLRGEQIRMTMISLAELIGFIGKNLGVSRWIEVDQSMIDQFARCTGDHQWIHVDVDRAKSESPAGRTIAHGFLSLALVAPLGMEVGLARRDASAVVNYGLDKVRFITPVKSGDRVRLQLSIESADRKDNGHYLVKSKAVLEIENLPSPALVAETLTLIMP